MTETIFFPTVNDSIHDFCKLFKIYTKISSSEAEYEINFSKCNFLRSNAVAFLGGIVRKMESSRYPVSLNTGSISDAVWANLAQNGFLREICGITLPWEGNSIPYREDSIMNKDSIIDYLKSKWLQRGFINVSPLLANRISGNLVEIYLNAFEHSKSDAGVFTCGQHYPDLKELTLSVIDFGVGIPYNVREFSKNNGNVHVIKSEHALKWAFQSGTTTAPGAGRGMGLDLLKQFIRANNGNLLLFSHDAYVGLNRDNENYIGHECNFHGTALHITLKCDEVSYLIKEELEHTSLF